MTWEAIYVRPYLAHAPHAPSEPPAPPATHAPHPRAGRPRPPPAPAPAAVVHVPRVLRNSTLVVRGNGLRIWSKGFKGASARRGRAAPSRAAGGPLRRLLRLKLRWLLLLLMLRLLVLLLLLLLVLYRYTMLLLVRHPHHPHPPHPPLDVGRRRNPPPSPLPPL